MNVKQFRYALEVESCGSFSKAGQAVFISQPAISFAIKELERELGFNIFERTNRGILPTQDGAKFLRAIRGVISQIDQIQSQYVQEIYNEESAILRIFTARYSFTAKAVIDFYNEYISKMPYCSLTLIEVENREVLQNVIDRKSDVGIIHTSNMVDAIQRERMEEKGIEIIPLFTSKAYGALRNDHPLSRESELAFDSIIHYPLIRFCDRELDYNTDETPFSFMKYRDSGKNIYTNSRAFLHNFLEKTDAIMLGTTNVGISEMQPGLQTVHIENDNTEFYLYAIKQRKHTRNILINKFISVLKKTGL